MSDPGRGRRGNGTRLGPAHQDVTSSTRARSRPKDPEAVAELEAIDEQG